MIANLFALGVFSALSAQAPAPMQSCEIRTESWCMLRSGVFFDERTINNEKRVWDWHGPSLQERHIIITEDRACSATFSDFQSSSHSVTTAKPSVAPKYTIEWKLSKDNTCKLKIEIPLIDGRKDEIAYDFVVRGLKACVDKVCSGPSLFETIQSSLTSNKGD